MTTSIPSPAQVAEARRLKQVEEAMAEKLRIAIKTAMEAGETQCTVGDDGIDLTTLQRLTNGVIAEVRAVGWATSHVYRGRDVIIDWCPHPELRGAT